MKLSKKIAILATALISFAFISCDTDTDDSKPPAESSGSTETGGSAGTGGSTGSGGSTETGGSTGTGGSTESGGSAGTGGSTEAGGGAGGSTESGGSAGGTGAGGSTGSGGSGETGGSTGSGGESEGNPVLPGIKGGAGNEKDTFAGKTFYNSDKKETAESYTKYVFSTDGTVEIYNKNEYSDGTSADAVINYSFSEDGNIVYMTYNKIKNPSRFNNSLYTYSEFVQYINTEFVEIYLESLNDPASGVDKEEVAKELGLESYTTDDALIVAIKEKILALSRGIFGYVYQYDLSNDAAGPAVLTERNTWGKDLSKFISLNGNTYYQKNTDDFIFRFSHIMGERYCSYTDSSKKPWHYRNVDSAKIYFEFKGEIIEAPYTISKDGKTLTTIIDGEVQNTIHADLVLGELKLF